MRRLRYAPNIIEEAKVGEVLVVVSSDGRSESLATVHARSVAYDHRGW